MVRVLLLPLLLTLGGVPDGAVDVRARVKTSSLKPDKSFQIEFRYALAKGYDDTEAGMPNPILQIKLPPSLAFDDPVLRTREELQKNEFLHAPYERLVELPKTRMFVRLKGEPGPDDIISLNFTAFISKKDGEASFVRRRLELPVKARAKAVAVAPAPSDWGEVDYIGLGDQADEFDLPKADGSRVKLSDFRGKQNVLVTMYRAFW